MSAKRSFVCVDPRDFRGEQVRCWKCPGCRSLRLWLRSLRIHLEALGHNDRVWMCTLTFKEAVNDTDGYPQVQKWLKRVRKACPKDSRIRYTCVCELGARNRRLHYHVVVYSQSDVKWRMLDCWTAGHAHYKLVSGRAAVRYVLKYMEKGHGKVRSSSKLGVEFMDRVHSCAAGVLDQFPGAVVASVGGCRVPRELRRTSGLPGGDQRVGAFDRSDSDRTGYYGMSEDLYHRFVADQAKSNSPVLSYREICRRLGLE